MSQEVKNIRIQQKVDTKENWENNNPRLENKEIGYERETGRYKIGDGIHNWNDLSYANNIKNIKDGENEGSLEGIKSTAMSKNSIAVGANSIAGGRGYKLTAFTNNEDGTGVCTVRTTEGLAVNMEYSIRVANMFCKAGKITAIDGLNITINGVPEKAKWETDDAENPESYTVENYLTIVGHPELGDTDVGFNAVSIGENNIAQDRASYTEGRQNKSIGQYAHTEGRQNIAGYTAHAEGRGNIAIGDMSHVEGHEVISSGNMSHAEGYQSQAIGKGSHAEGIHSISEGEYAHAEGVYTKATGQGAHSEGYQSKAIGEYAHAEGVETKAAGNMSHAEGYQSQAIGKGSHAEGIHSMSEGEYAHAEGVYTKAIGKGAHSEGYQSKAIGEYAHAEGKDTIAKGYCQHVQGVYNLEDKDGFYLHIVGNGDSSKRSNAHTITWGGDGWFAGTVKVGRATTDSDDDLILVTKGYLKNLINSIRQEISDIKADVDALQGGATVYPVEPGLPGYDM